MYSEKDVPEHALLVSLILILLIICNLCTIRLWSLLMVKMEKL